jgi:hypothetical protein
VSRPTSSLCVLLALAAAGEVRAQTGPGEPPDPVPDVRVIPVRAVRVTEEAPAGSKDAPPDAPAPEEAPHDAPQGAEKEQPPKDGTKDGTAQGAPKAPPQQPPSSQSAPAAAGPPSPFSPEDTWWDLGHAILERRLFAPVARLDRFFSDERELEHERSRSFLRFRNVLRFSQDGDPVYGVNVRADLRLPGLNRWLDRLRLVIAGESDDTSSALFPNDPNAAPIRGNRVGQANAELRYGIWDGLVAHLDLGGGVLFRLPPGVFGRVRYRVSLPVADLFLTRFATTGFWRTDTRFGTSGALELERPLGPASLARIGGSGELSEVSRGVEWASEIAFLRTIGPRRAISLGAVMEGATDAPVAVDRYRIYTRLRRELWRRWIFAEVEPEIGWPWDVDAGRHRVLAVTLRLEVQFQGTELAQGERRAAREPADPPMASDDPAR